jgi:hypothetical protein
MKKQEVKDLINFNRQCGQTTALLEAAEKISGILIVGDNSQIYSIKANHPNTKVKIVSIHNLSTLRGKSITPLFFDNTAILQLCDNKSLKIKEAIDILEQLCA